MSFNQIMPAASYSGGNHFSICCAGVVAFNTSTYRASTWLWWAGKRPCDRSFSGSRGVCLSNHR